MPKVDQLPFSPFHVYVFLKIGTFHQSTSFQKFIVFIWIDNKHNEFEHYLYILWYKIHKLLKDIWWEFYF